MKPIRLFAAAALLVALASAPAWAHGKSDEAREAIRHQVVALLDAYAANNPDAVLALVDTDGFVMYGSDVAEVVRDPKQLRQLMADDFALWHTASFGPPSNLDIRVEGAMASAFFDAPFSAGGRPPLTVRFSTVWRKTHGHWRLLQGANAVPTVGSSAHQLVHAK